MATVTVTENNTTPVVVVGPVTSTGAFKDLTDTPISYVGNGGRILVTRQDELGLEFVPAYGTGDMTKATYDTNNDGVVDNSEALGGIPAANYYQIGDPVDSTKYTHLAIPPAHVEGQIYYDSVFDALTVQTKFPDVHINLGQEMLIEVYNDTGVTITNGQVVRHDGVDGGGMPKIALALADNFVNSIVLGVATHDIPNATSGYITVSGTVHHTDTSGYPVGVPMYLSDTIPGGLTAFPPDIVTQVGGVLISDAVDGSLQVSIINTITNTPIHASFQFTTVPVAITSTPTEFSNFLDNHSIVMDISSGNSFLIPAAGRYEVNFVVSMSNITASSSGHIIFIEVYNKTSMSVAYTFNMVVGRSDTVASCSFQIPLPFAVGDDIVLRHWSNTAVGSAVVLDGLSVYANSRHLDKP